MSTAYCPNCKSITKMNAKGAAKQPLREYRFYYKRQKTCAKCNEVITTVEVEESLIMEYDKLKLLMNELHAQIRPYVTNRFFKSNR
jgi:hypothetical protein